MANNPDVSIPDVILPTQYHIRSRLDTPEKHLLFAVLDDAISVATQRMSVLDKPIPIAGVSPRRVSDRKYSTRVRGGLKNEARQEALDWIASDAEDSIFCFVPICHLFDLDPEAIRCALAKNTTPIPALRLRPGGMQLPQIGSAGRQRKRKWDEWHRRYERSRQGDLRDC